MKLKERLAERRRLKEELKDELGVGILPLRHWGRTRKGLERAIWDSRFDRAAIKAGYFTRYGPAEYREMAEKVLRQARTAFIGADKIERFFVDYNISKLRISYAKKQRLREAFNKRLDEVLKEIPTMPEPEEVIGKKIAMLKAVIKEEKEKIKALEK